MICDISTVPENYGYDQYYKFQLSGRVLYAVYVLQNINRIKTRSEYKRITLECFWEVYEIVHMPLCISAYLSNVLLHMQSRIISVEYQSNS